MAVVAVNSRISSLTRSSVASVGSKGAVAPRLCSGYVRNNASGARPLSNTARALAQVRVVFNRVTGAFHHGRRGLHSISTRLSDSHVNLVDKKVQLGGGYLSTGHRNLDAENSPRFLVTGAVGQIGSELVPALREKYGTDNVVATDIKQSPRGFSRGPYMYLDVMNADSMAAIVLEQRISTVIHLASLLSAAGERNPMLALKLNTRGTENVLNLAAQNKMAVFAPSTIGVFGPETPHDNTPDLTVLRPKTIYGITKVYTELLGEYYHHKFGVDFRSLRYPGIISSAAMPGGGTTDYAVEIYHDALRTGSYKCFLKEDSEMPMMYMPDCIGATMTFLEAPESKLTQRVYNVTGFSFTPAQQYEAIKKIIPGFKIEYHPDFRQEIADSWPNSLDDSMARRDWGWDPKYNLESMTASMLNALAPMYVADRTQA